MRIAIIIPIIGTFGRRGYYNSQEVGLAKELYNLGYTVDIYKGIAKRDQKSVESEKAIFGTICYCPTASIGPHGMFDLGYIKDKPDAVIVFSDTQLFIKRIYAYCQKNNITFIPYVGIAHSFQKNIKSKVIDSLFKLVTVPVYKKSIVLAKTKDAKKELINLGVSGVEIAPVGIDFEKLNKDYEKVNRDKLREKYGYSGKDFVISFVGKLQPKKHPLEMLDIFQSITREDKRLLIVGKGPLLGQVRDKVEKLGIQLDTQLFEEIKYDDMWEIHWISDVLVNLCEWEIFGMAIMEAIYYKTAVVAINAPGPNTILEDMTGSFLCRDYKSVLRCLENLSVNTDLLQDAKEILCKKYTWENSAITIHRLMVRK